MSQTSAATAELQRAPATIVLAVLAMAGAMWAIGEYALAHHNTFVTALFMVPEVMVALLMTSALVMLVKCVLGASEDWAPAILLTVVCGVVLVLLVWRVTGRLEHIEGSIRKLFFWLFPLGVPVWAMMPKKA